MEDKTCPILEHVHVHVRMCCGFAMVCVAVARAVAPVGGASDIIVWLHRQAENPRRAMCCLPTRPTLNNQSFSIFSLSPSPESQLWCSRLPITTRSVSPLQRQSSKSRKPTANLRSSCTQVN